MSAEVRALPQRRRVEHQVVHGDAGSQRLDQKEEVWVTEYREQSGARCGAGESYARGRNDQIGADADHPTNRDHRTRASGRDRVSQTALGCYHEGGGRRTPWGRRPRSPNSTAPAARIAGYCEARHGGRRRGRILVAAGGQEGRAEQDIRFQAKPVHGTSLRESAVRVNVTV